MIFTRYLYIKDEVKLSLLISILNKTDSVLFWTYELYYSGFEEELFEYLLKIYYDFYYTINPTFLDYFIKKYEIWKNDEEENKGDKDVIVGMIAKNLSTRNYNSDVFNCVNNNNNNNHTNNKPFKMLLEEKDYQGIANLVLNEKISIQEIMKIMKQKYRVKGFLNINKNLQILAWIIKNPSPNKKNVCIVLQDKDILKYKNIVKTDKIKAYLILERACLYEIDDSNYLYLFKLERDNLTKVKYWYHWLYYASFSPLWKRRIEMHNGIIDNEKKEVIFSDEDAELFYDNYGYEPDEQPKEVQEKSMKEIKEKEEEIKEKEDGEEEEKKEINTKIRYI